jgi:NAD(P)-dependent dehydrogenase (short-subunit alcohol dehydrogenase family)
MSVDLEIADFEATMRTNLIGQLICCKHFINHRKQQGGGGKILNTTSVHQEQPRAGQRTTTAPRAPCATSRAPWFWRSRRWG